MVIIESGYSIKQNKKEEKKNLILSDWCFSLKKDNEGVLSFFFLFLMVIIYLIYNPLYVSLVTCISVGLFMDYRISFVYAIFFGFGTIILNETYEVILIKNKI